MYTWSECVCVQVCACVYVYVRLCHGVCVSQCVCVCATVCMCVCACVPLCMYDCATARVGVCERYCFNCCVWYFNCFNYITLSSKESCCWCCACCIVLLTLCIIILRACHDHNRSAPCGMIQVFLIELKLGETLGYWNHSHVYANFKNKAEDK